MKGTSVPYETGLAEDLCDPEEVVAYLNAAIEDGSQELFLLALRDVAVARGISSVANQTKLNRENVYRILSAQGNPQLSSLVALLDGLGLMLAVRAKRRARS
jgi:probable addiction module antidote protein